MNNYFRCIFICCTRIRCSNLVITSQFWGKWR